MNPDVRCRLVARDFKDKKDNDREDLFAATPPAEAERMALSKAVTKSRRKDGGDQAEEDNVYRCQEGAPQPKVRSTSLY